MCSMNCLNVRARALFSVRAAFRLLDAARRQTNPLPLSRSSLMTEARAPLSSWSDIPLELAGLVLCRLPAHVDRVRFAAVCPQWRAAAREVPLPPPLPLLALPDGTIYSLPCSEPLRFPACAGYADACGNCLAFLEEGGCFLRNPLSNATVALPGMFRVQAPRRGAGEQPVDETGVTWSEMEDSPEKLTMYKLLFCSPWLIATFIRFQKSAWIAVCRPGSTWWMSFTLLTFAWTTQQDIHGFLEFSAPSGACLFVEFLHMTDEICITRELYLVELRGALLLVHRKMHSRLMNQAGKRTAVPTGVNEFEVFKANFERSQWTKVTTIGDDQVLFLRRLCSRFVFVSQNEMPGDCIVFFENDDEDYDWFDEENSYTWHVYDMKNGNVSTYRPICSWKPGPVPATWLFPEA
ncbi:hypothetical protein QOZ80_4AG0318260 [Eleusine coracana subsp. coracana]|nr:hypothetical protein QOZ80_4AG0318260 [Eleusine coracana subsp. coracana]